ALLGALGGLGHPLRLPLRLGNVLRHLRGRSALGQRATQLGLLLGTPLLLLARLVLRTSVVLLRLAEELRQGALAHARPLTACHSPGPPPLAGGRRRPPS